MRLPSFRSTGVEFSPIKDSDQGIAVNLGATTLAANGFQRVDLDVTGFSTLKLVGMVGNVTTPATAAADAGVGMNTYLADKATLLTSTGPGAVRNWTAALVNNVAATGGEWDVSGYTLISIYVKNANAGALQGARLDYFLQR